MRAAALLATPLLVTFAWAQDAPQAPEAERPPERPEALASEAEPETPRPETRPEPADLRPPPEAPVTADPPASGDDTSPQPSQREVLRESDMSFSICLLTLRMLGTGFEAGEEITGPKRDCGIARPVTVTEALPGLTLEGAPPMRCQTARALGWWLRDHLLPASRHLPGAPRPVALVLGTTYQCRDVVGDSGEPARLSEHAFGNALDIAAIRFDSGETVAISQADGNDMASAFLAAIRGAACLYFTTVLGPGSNTAHEDHLHLDIKEREGGYRICD